MPPQALNNKSEMAGNTRRARSLGNLLLDPDTDDDTTIDNSLDTAYLLRRTREHSLDPLPFNTIHSSLLRAVGHAHWPSRSTAWRPAEFVSRRHARSSPLVNSTKG